MFCVSLAASGHHQYIGSGRGLLGKVWNEESAASFPFWESDTTARQARESRVKDGQDSSLVGIKCQ